MNFASGTFHQNRKGFFVAFAVSGQTASIRYQDRAVATSDVSALQRIEDNLLREKTFEEKKRMQFDDACEYLKREGIAFQPEDKFEVFRAANEHKESRRLVELHRSFLVRRGIPVEGRSLVALATDIQKAHGATGCYSCRSSPDDFVHLECAACRWIMCPTCGACGCGYSKK